jgi:hypothetical protein
MNIKTIWIVIVKNKWIRKDAKKFQKSSRKMKTKKVANHLLTKSGWFAYSQGDYWTRAAQIWMSTKKLPIFSPLFYCLRSKLRCKNWPNRYLFVPVLSWFRGPCLQQSKIVTVNAIKIKILQNKFQAIFVI